MTGRRRDLDWSDVEADAQRGERIAQCREEYGEAHDAHMELNGECPWCGATGESDPSLDGLSSEDAVAEVVRRHG